MVNDSPVSRRVRSPSWLDLRLVAGVALVLISVLVGVRLVSAADHTTRFWAADHDLAAGVVLAAVDVRSVSARLGAAGGDYVATTSVVVGRAIDRSIGAGELLPRSSLGSPDPATTVTIPLGGDNAPRISAGERITVWVSTRLCPAAVVLADVTVQSVVSARTGALTASGGEDVVVRIASDSANRVIEALALDAGVLRAGILDGGALSSVALPDLSRCAQPSS